MCPQKLFKKKKKNRQESFHAHFVEVKNNGEDDWEVRLIDQNDNVEDVRKKESFWQHKLDNFQPNGLMSEKWLFFDI